MPGSENEPIRSGGRRAAGRRALERRLSKMWTCRVRPTSSISPPRRPAPGAKPARLRPLRGLASRPARAGCRHWTGLAGEAARRRWGRPVVGCDGSPAMLERAQRLAQGAGSGETAGTAGAVAPAAWRQPPGWTVSAVQRLAFAEGAFDAALATNLLFLLPDPAAGLRNWCGWCGPAGGWRSSIPATDEHGGGPGVSGWPRDRARPFQLSELCPPGRRASPAEREHVAQPGRGGRPARSAATRRAPVVWCCSLSGFRR